MKDNLTTDLREFEHMDQNGYRNRYVSQSLEVEKSALLRNKYERQKVTGDNHKLKNRINMLENE